MFKKNQFYFLYGYDNGLINYNIENIKNTYKNSEYIIYDINKFTNNLDIIKENILNISMFFSYRIFTLNVDKDYIFDILKDLFSMPLPEYSIIILNGYKCLKNSNITSLCLNNKNCTTIPCYTYSEKQKESFIKDFLNKNHFKIDYEALILISEALESDLQTIINELKKLILYKGNNNIIKINDIKNVISDKNYQNIFNKIDEILLKNFKNKEILLNIDTYVIISLWLHIEKLIFFSQQKTEMNFKKFKIHFTRENKIKKEIEKFSLKSLSFLLRNIYQNDKNSRKHNFLESQLRLNCILNTI